MDFGKFDGWGLGSFASKAIMRAKKELAWRVDSVLRLRSMIFCG